ncbi:MAG TPA: hypothetical protein VFP54_00270 [Acidimicrobiales bacterium]|nr:hypothetical protein [Acidimicrobiales bacterium]
MSESAVRVVVVHPDLLGTYGDGGNGVILARRLEWRAVPVELISAPSGSPLPDSCDVYCLGGGEDSPQVRAAVELADGRPLARAVERGAAVLAVCAGFQVLGTSFIGPGGAEHPGLGLIDVRTVRGSGPRAVGELVAEPLDGSPMLTGYENHASATERGPGVAPLGRVVSGVGNGAGDGTEGAVAGKVFCTYMHGPVLARNPALADRILTAVVGGELAPLDDSEHEALRAERLSAVPDAAAGRRRGRRA